MPRMSAKQLATLEDRLLGIVFIDIGWGAVLTATVGVSGCHSLRWLG